MHASRSACLCTLACAVATGAAHAQFRLFDDFDDDPLGPIDNVDGWDSAGGANAVAPDPAEPANHVLLVPSASSTLHKPLTGLTVRNGESRMLFLRLRVAQKQTFSVGLSFLAHPVEYSDFGPEVGMANSAQNLDLRVWDDDGDMYEKLIQLEPDTWYNLWMQVDAANDRCALWLNAIPGADALPEHRLAAQDGDDLFEFRAGRSSDMISFYVRTSGGDSGQNFGPVYLDDIHLELTDSPNLTNPLTACPADLDGDGVLDLADVSAFAAAFIAEQPPADQAAPYRLFDLADITAFVQSFLAGCP